MQYWVTSNGRQNLQPHSLADGSLSCQPHTAVVECCTNCSCCTDSRWVTCIIAVFTAEIVPRGWSAALQQQHHPRVVSIECDHNPTSLSHLHPVFFLIVPEEYPIALLVSPKKRGPISSISTCVRSPNAAS